MRVTTVCLIFLVFYLVECKKSTDVNDSKILGNDGHDQKPHGKKLLGQDDHDKKAHRLLGQDDHDKKAHRLLGQDDHDKKAHKKEKLIGGGDHDYKAHGKNALVGDDKHDLGFKKPSLGSGDHDMKPHGKKQLLGADKHDLGYKKKKFGSGDHDMKPHGKRVLGGSHDMAFKKFMSEKMIKQKKEKLKHKKEMAKKLLGANGHGQQGFKKDKKELLGADGHDFKYYAKQLVGGDDHDERALKKGLIGGDGHDKKAHKAPLGADGHDEKAFKKLNSKKLIGSGDHDYKNHGKQHLIGGAHDYFYNKKSMKKVLRGGKHNNFNKKKRVDKLNHLQAFESFMNKHNKVYSTEKEKKKRFAIFRDNMKKSKLYQQNEKGSATYGVTQFSDLTQKEFKKMLGFRPHLKPALSKMQTASIPDIKVPTEFDWREEEVVTPVKNQGMCGSCWAFSTTGNVEGQWAIKHGKLLSLSEQELVDCDKTDQGCNGGLPENAYHVIEELGGLETEDMYPYDGKDEKCHIDKTKFVVQVNGSVELPDDEDQIAAWLVKNGPVSIGINANPLQFYTGGVSHPLKFMCKPEDLDHGMLIVGFGVHQTKYLHRTQPYWIIKNSWGPDWGEQGYYRIYRGDGSCGVNRMVTSAVVP